MIQTLCVVMVMLLISASQVQFWKNCSARERGKHVLNVLFLQLRSRGWHSYKWPISSEQQLTPCAGRIGDLLTNHNSHVIRTRGRIVFTEAFCTYLYCLMWFNNGSCYRELLPWSQPSLSVSQTHQSGPGGVSVQVHSSPGAAMSPPEGQPCNLITCIVWQSLHQSIIKSLIWLLQDANIVTSMHCVHVN